MDVEIVKQNGQSFRLSDYGVVQDFVVNSIDRSVVRDPIDGRSGLQDYGVEIGDRTIEVPMIFKAEDLHDYVHLRDELYGLLDDSEPFYIREMRRPKELQYDFVDFGQKPKWEAQTDNEYVNGKQYLVRLNSTLTPEQRSLSGEVSIEFVTSGNPYAESVYTTLELHDSGYSATAEKYGLVDNIDDEKVKYRFVQEGDYNANLIPLVQTSWEVGNWYTTNGAAGGMTGNLRTKIGQISVTEGEWYTFDDSSAYASAIGTVYLLHYKNGTYVGSSGGWLSLNRGGRTSFVAKGDEIRISLRPTDVNNIPLSHINHTDKRIQMKLELGEDHTGYNPSSSSFNVYNAGNVAVEPESMYISILFWYCSIPNGKMTIKNMTTGDTLIINSTENRRHIRQDGMVFTIGGVNRFRDTNRSFISLAPGDNRFEITGAIFDEVRIDFKYYYR